MMKKLIYSMFLILSVVTLFTACQEKENPPITTGSSGITRDLLEGLVTVTDNIKGIYYTAETHNAMKAKLDAAKTLLAGSPTSEQIATAYADLLAAKNALVRVPRGVVVSLYIYSLIEDTVYINNKSFDFYLPVYAVDVERNHATDVRVAFDYDEEELKALTEDGIIYVDDNELRFKAKSSLTSGTTVSLTVKSVGNSSVSQKISLKVPAPGEIKSMFIGAVSALPPSKGISYEHYAAIDKAFSFYYYLSMEERETLAVETALTKLEDCDEAYEYLPQRIKYSFKGDVSTLIAIEGVSDELYVGDYDFVAKGEFPAGMYTEKGWVRDYGDEEYPYCQYMFILNGDKTGLVQVRRAKTSNGTGATDWAERGRFTYTFDGNKDHGGMFILTFENESGGEIKVPTKSTLRKVRKLVR